MKTRKKNILVICLSMLLMFANCLDAFAADKPMVDTKEDVINIDAKATTPETGKTLEEVLGLRNGTRATTMPKETWDWNEGDYSGTFEIQFEYSYTLYNFTGYGTYYVDVQASRNIETAASDNYTVYLMKGSGQGTIATSYSFDSTDFETVRFYNLDPGTKYSICFSKANDGSILSGSFKVRH